jgi:hypothetical protein
LGHQHGVRGYCVYIMGMNVCYEYQLFALLLFWYWYLWGSMWK